MLSVKLASMLSHAASSLRLTLGHQKGLMVIFLPDLEHLGFTVLLESAPLARSRIHFDQVFVEARRKVFMPLMLHTHTSENKFPCRVSAFTAAFTVRGRAQRLRKRFTKCGFTNAAPTRCFCDDHKGILSARHYIYAIFVAYNMCTLS